MRKNYSKKCKKILAKKEKLWYTVKWCFMQHNINGRRTVLMKEGIHPEYKQTTIKCACGEVIEIGSTKENINVEICSKCHPFYTGKQKLIDTGGRVEKFNRKFNRK